MDAKFEEIRAAHPASFACRLGCHSCCKPGLTVNALEFEEIRLFLEARPELRAEITRDKPHGASRCGYLGAQGECRIYEVRPIVCRSHGAPLQFRDPAAKPGDEKAMRLRDVCPLNFTGEDLARVPAQDVLNLDTLNTLLALLAERALPGAERQPLMDAVKRS